MATAQVSELRDQARRLPTGHAPAVLQQNPCPDSPFCLKQEELRAVTTPEVTIEPGGTVQVDVELLNRAGAIGPFDPDACRNTQNTCEPSGGTDGYCVEVRVEHPNGTETKRTCHSFALAGPQPLSVPLQFTAPSTPGDYPAVAEIFFPGSGSGPSERVEGTFTVAEGGADRGTPPSNGDGNGNGGGGLQERELFFGFALLLVALFGVASLVP